MEQNNRQIDDSDQTAKSPATQGFEPAQQMEHMRRAVIDNLSRKIQAMLNSCVDCGLCAESCHYYCSTGDSAVIPANKFKILARVLQTYFHPLKSRIPFSSNHHPDEQMLAALYTAAFEHCTLCAKCALSCPMGINTGEILSLARAILCSIGRLPSGLIAKKFVSASKGS